MQEDDIDAAIGESVKLSLEVLEERAQTIDMGPIAPAAKYDGRQPPPSVSAG